MRVLVTGAEGFVAGPTIRALTNRGHEIVGTTRRNMAAAAEFILIPDIGPETDWSAALTGVKAIVHLAARVHITRETAANPLDAFRRVNRDGTARLVGAAIAAGVQTFAFVSTIGVVCQHSDIPVTETMPCAPATPYAISKFEAERAVLEASSRMRVVVLRPPMIYGSNAPGNFRPLVRAVRSGVPLPFGAVRNRRSFLFVGNLADALALAIDDSRAQGVYHVADDLGVSTPEFVTMIGDALGRRARFFSIPVSGLRLAARLTGTRQILNKLVESLPVDAGRFTRDVGWHPRLSMREAVRASLMSA